LFLPKPGTSIKGHMSDFMPDSRDGKKSWYTNLKTQIEKPENDFGLTTVEKNAVVNQCDEQLALYETTDEAAAALANAREAERTGIAAGDAVLRGQIKSWKVKSTFLPGIAAALQVVASSGSSSEPLKVKFKVRVQNGHGVYLDWTKGKLDGVNVYARLRGESAWVKIGMDTSAPYLDSRPLASAGVPEVREYMLHGVIKDEEVGVDSDILSATYAG